MTNPHDQTLIDQLLKRGYAVFTSDQYDQLCDALGPASDDILQMIFNGEDHDG